MQTDKEVLDFIEIYDENLKDIVTGLLFDRQQFQERIDALEKSVFVLNGVANTYYQMLEYGKKHADKLIGTILGDSIEQHHKLMQEVIDRLDPIYKEKVKDEA